MSGAEERIPQYFQIDFTLTLKGSYWVGADTEDEAKQKFIKENPDPLDLTDYAPDPGCRTVNLDDVFPIPARPVDLPEDVPNRRDLQGVAFE